MAKSNYKSVIDTSRVRIYDLKVLIRVNCLKTHYKKDWREIITKIHQITFENSLPNYFRTISSVWHGINTVITSTCGVQEALKGGISLGLGNEITVSFWTDKWPWNDCEIIRKTFPCLYAIAS
jgi:hypothetical protein